MSDSFDSRTLTAAAVAVLLALSNNFLLPPLNKRLDAARQLRSELIGMLDPLDQKARHIFRTLQEYSKNAPAQISALQRALADGATVLTPAIWYSPGDMGRDNQRVEVSKHMIAVLSARLSATLALMPALQGLLESREHQSLTALASTMDSAVSVTDAEGMPQLASTITASAREAATKLRDLQAQTAVLGAVVLQAAVALAIVVLMSPFRSTAGPAPLILTVALLCVPVLFLIHLVRLWRLARFASLLPPAPA